MDWQAIRAFPTHGVAICGSAVVCFAALMEPAFVGLLQTESVRPIPQEIPWEAAG